MNSIFVPLGSRSYRIEFCPLSSIGAAIRRILKPSAALIVTTAAVHRAGFSGKVAAALKKQGLRVETVVIADGEQHKNLHTLTTLYRAALKSKLDRRSVIVAVGGGVVTDLAGFLAATYMRGIALVSVPTTLLAMVDASIGGKTGVDLPEGKNLVGAFWQPRLVWIDQQVLKTLPQREWKTGFAEIIKYGVIKDRAFFAWLEKKFKQKADVRRWPTKDIAHAIYTSAAIKAKVISADERETPLKGGREILNFGHTFGHALEAATRYTKLTHGEAIAIGMVAAGRLARMQKLWSDDEQLQLTSMFEAAGLPISCPPFNAQQLQIFWNALSSDKKNIGGKLRFVIPQKIGKVRVQSGIDKDSVARALGFGR